MRWEDTLINLLSEACECKLTDNGNPYVLCSRHHEDALSFMQRNATLLHKKEHIVTSPGALRAQGWDL